MKLKKAEKEQLLNLARNSLNYIFRKKKGYSPNTERMPKKLKEKKATFVTLTKNGELRGCIGSLLASKPIYQDIIENTYKAAFSDYRFPQLDKSELADVRIEISILTKPEDLEYKSQSDLISILEREKPGVIISEGLNSATFLPQVWDEITRAEDFLSHLCQKAGFDPDEWKGGRLAVQTYKVLNFKEK